MPDGLLRQVDAPGQVTVADGLSFAVGLQLRQAKLADRLQHPEAQLAVPLTGLPHQAPRHQLRHYVEGFGSRDSGFGGSGNPTPETRNLKPSTHHGLSG